jgi:peptidoglycan/xylan/chitin deacetylase (PgdA/CDA1 family)
LRNRIKKLAAGVSRWLGARDRSTPILMYHSVHPDHPLAVTPAAFREQIAYLVEKYKVVSLREYLEAKINNCLTPGTAAVTFDDGYRDNYRFAFPILKEFSCPATIFVVTGFIGSDDYLTFGRKAGLYPDLEPLTWPELKEMHPLVEVGAHTHSHIQISGVKEQVLKREFAANIGIIQEKLGYSPGILAYPWGQPFDFSRPGCTLVQEYFQGAVTTVYNSDNRSSRISSYHLRRVGIGPGDDIGLFAAKVAGDFDYIGLLKGVQARWGDKGDRNTRYHL